jgi:hypothetical protein
MSARVTFLTAVMMIGCGCGAAHANCRAAVSEFEAIINSDLETGNVAKRVHARMTSELTQVKTTCSAGRDAEATRALAAVKSRHGYR